MYLLSVGRSFWDGRARNRDRAVSWRVARAREALGDRVCELLDDEEQRRALGRAARRLMIDDYDLQKTCLPRQLPISTPTRNRLATAL